MDFWVPKGNLGMGEEGHSQHGDVRTGGEDRAPPPPLGAPGPPKAAREGCRPPPRPRGAHSLGAALQG